MACLAAFLACMLVLGAQARTDPKLCKKMSVTGLITTAVGNFTFNPPVPVCLEFYSTGSAAIKAPKDTATATYGMLNTLNHQESEYALLDRAGNTYAFNSTLLPKDVLAAISVDMKLPEQFIFKAAVNTKTKRVVAFFSAMYIPHKTMVQSWAKSSFIGSIVNLGASQNISEGGLTRFDFASNITTNPFSGAYSSPFPMLMGKIMNWDRSIRINNTCSAALCGENSTDCSWYQRFWGTPGLVGLYWDPAMHMPGDSEMVLQFWSGISYMSRGQRVVELLTSKVNRYSTFDFTIHGNPMDTLFQVTGPFTQRTTVKGC